MFVWFSFHSSCLTYKVIFIDDMTRFHCNTIEINVYLLILVLASIIDCFQLFAIIDNNTMNIPIHITRVNDLLGFLGKNQIAKSQDIYIINLSWQ